MIAEYFNDSRHALVIKDDVPSSYIVSCKENDQVVKEVKFHTLSGACDYAEDWVMKW